MTREQLVEDIMAEMEEASKSSWAEFIVRLDLSRLIKRFEEDLIDSIREQVESLKDGDSYVSLNDVLNQIY